MHRSLSFQRAVGFFLVFGLAAGVGARVALGNPNDLKDKPAPKFKLKTYNDKPDVVLSKLKGKVVVLDFWATWCPPCRASLPHLQKTADDKGQGKKGLRVVAVNCGEGKDKIEPFMTQNNYTFNVAMDSNQKVKSEYGVEGIPTTVIIGRDGVVRAVFIGWSGDDTGRQIDQAIEAALKEK